MLRWSPTGGDDPAVYSCVPQALQFVVTSLNDFGVKLGADLIGRLLVGLRFRQAGGQFVGKPVRVGVVVHCRLRYRLVQPLRDGGERRQAGHRALEDLLENSPDWLDFR